MSNWWSSLPRGRRNMAIVMLVVFALIIAAALYGWVRTLSGADTTADAGKKPETSEQSTNEPSTDDGEEAADDNTIVVRDEYEFEIDENGMAVMPVTKDPREAAAGAAAVAFSVNFSKLTRQEFVDTAIHRMTHPSDQYVGAEGQIHTVVDAAPFQETKRYYYSPEEALQLRTDAWLQQDNPENFTWWTLANGNTYDNFTMLPDHFWLAHPDKILSEEEIAAIDESLLPNFGEATDMQPDTPGATLTQWWVLSDVDNSKVGTAAATSLHPAHFAIWCDAPEDGGLCGVAYTLDTKFPDVWPRQ